ncbi:MAG: site-specific integrase [Pseudolabrys sp.]
MKLTDKLIKGLVAPERGNRITYDDDVKGFGARITAAGAKSFVLTYWSAGRQRRYTIGRYPDWPLATARSEAKRLKLELRANGSDPLARLELARDAPTMAGLCQRYLEEHASKKCLASRADDTGMIRAFVLPAFGPKKVAEITFSDCDGLHRKITRRGTKHRANRVIALLSKAFNLSIRWGWRPDNPCKGIERNPEGKRTRYLSADELVRLTEVLAEYDDQQAANTIRLLLLTGARSGEVFGARWADLDLENGVWTKPGHTTKQKTEHRVPLSAPALELLTAIRAKAPDNTELVFPGADLRTPWPKICKAAGITGVRVHDLRHTFASVLASAGFSLPMIGALLGHTQPGTTARYAHLFDDPLRQATERVGAIIAGKPGAEVRRLRK